ncbi:MAG TPA: terminase family protein [Candidatus Paceibacterota bacterium]|nr:terminase family protein [Candidatus Paceibacterota bacterium]
MTPPDSPARPPYFLPYQLRWRQDPSRLRICQKARQVGLSWVDSYDSVIKAGVRGGRDVWVMSRDELQARQYIRYCKRWARLLDWAAAEHGQLVLSPRSGRATQTQALTFASGATIYALSSNPDAIVGKTGHVKLDEFALHRDQRTLYAVAKPVIQWGGTLSIISTHRGVGTVFNQLITDIQQHGNPMGWALHTVPIQAAVEQGLVEAINAATGARDSREAWLARQRAECIDEEQWLQEYCCVPADESAAFITYDMLDACEEEDCLRDFAALQSATGRLYLGVDVARKHDLCVLDVGEKIGDVVWDRLRLELSGRSFSELEFELRRLLALPRLHRACIDATGLGLQLAEQARERFGWKVEPVTFTPQVKEELAFGLRTDFETRRLRIPRDERLRADLRSLRKEVTATGHFRFAGEGPDSHCDRFWAKALRQHAVRHQPRAAARAG